MKRRMFEIVAGLFLVLSLATIVDRCTHPWQTHWWGFNFDYGSGSAKLKYNPTMQSGNGVIMVAFSVYREGPGWTPTKGDAAYGVAAPGTLQWQILPATLLHRAGFGPFSWSQSGLGCISQRGLEVPSWFLALIFAIVPGARFAIGREKRCRVLGNQCVICGYDLRATPDRCPECGTFPKPKTLLFEEKTI